MTDLAVILARYSDDLLKVAQHASATLSTAVHDGTPRDTGAAQNSWSPAVNSFNRSGTGGAFIPVANRLKIGDYYTLMSRLHYIRRLEYGWSRQAPAGMLRINVARWSDVVAHSVRQVRGS